MVGLKGSLRGMLLMGALATSALAGDPPGWMRWARGPECGLEDVYKAIHQAWRGPGHMIPSREAAAEYLHQEWSTLEGGAPEEAMVDTLDPGAPFVRLNLRPFRDAGGSESTLLDAFMRSAAAPTDSAAMVREWTDVGRACLRGDLPFTRAAYDHLDSLARPLGYPAIHHSARYEALRHPAYRVLTLAEARSLISGLPGRRGR